VQHEVDVPFAAPWSHCSPDSTAPLPQMLVLLMTKVSKTASLLSIALSVMIESFAIRTSAC
jgi:hypothetical protein